MDIYAGAVGRKTEVTDYFPERGPVPKLEVERGFLKEAFSLGEAEPFSNAVRSNDDFYVLGFVGSKPPEIPALDAVKDQIQKILAARKAHEAALTAAEARSREVRETMEKGQSFADACAALNLKVVSPPPFSIFGIYSGTAEEVPHASGIIPRVDELETGEISQTIENADGAMFFHLRARQAVDSETFEKEKARFADLLWAQAWQSAYTDWRTVKVAPEISIKSSRRR
jgi:enamine deaminase RidA (YjgF/YER057c/UK114 family)